eukprot:Nk52_evm124s151 gene=Nk52_evmTU124s151
MVKFEEELMLKAKKEWRANYIQYSKLKRIIDKIEIAIEDEEYKQSRHSNLRMTRTSVMRRKVSTVHMGGTIPEHEPARKASRSEKSTDKLHHGFPEDIGVDLIQPKNVCPLKREEFFTTVDADVCNVNDFFCSKFEEIEAEMNVHLPRYAPDSDDDSKAAEQDKLVDLYLLCKDLEQFGELNALGFRKITKKYDKLTGEQNVDDIMKSVKSKRFSTDTVRLKEFRKRIEGYLRELSFSDGSVSQTLEKLKYHSKQNKVDTVYVWKPMWLLIGAIVGVALYFIPFYSDEERAHRCLCMLIFITIAWVMESMPFFVTALSIPLLSIFLQIIQTDFYDTKTEPTTCHFNSTANEYEPTLPTESYNAEDSAKLIFSHIFDNTLALVIGGFSISAAFSKYKFQLQIALYIQKNLEDYPRLFILAFMGLGAFLSMWISNVAGSVLITSLLLPIIRDLNNDSRFTQTSIIAVAFACNVGGMLSPIASPQNAVATGVVAGTPQSISFLQWLEVAVPFGVVGIVVIWAYFMLVGKPNDVAKVPEIVLPRYTMTITHWVVLVVSFLTIILWCSLQGTDVYLGSQGIVALIPIVIFFGTGILTKQDWNNFSWNLVFLIGGGNILGLAVSNSHLLALIVNSITPTLEKLTFFELTIVMSALIIFITTFISHTVASLILMPVLQSLGDQLGCTQKLIMIGALATSSSMALPMSGFPNINALLLEDDYGRQYLKVIDFVKNGSICSFILFILNSTLGYLLVTAVFG